MKRCSLFCNGWWSFLWILFLSGLLLLLLLFFKWDPIEKDVKGNALSSLQAEGYPWAEVETYHRGREVLLTGTAPDQASVDNAISVARGAEGVNSVRWVGDFAELTPPSLSVIKDRSKVTLSGTVADQATVNDLVTKAGQRYGDDNVINQLQVREYTKALPNIGSLMGILDDTKSRSMMRLRDGVITLAGEVDSENIKTSIGSKVASVFSGKVNNQLIVAAAPAPVVASKGEVCRDSVNELLSESKINFETGSANIKQDSNDLLQNIAGVAKNCPEVRFEVAGHTDSTGSLEFNNRLSGQRAQAVVRHLIGLGLNSSRFDAAGYGPSQPVGDNATSEGRAQNRRIEFKLIN